ncbi:alpha/beta hydrolase family protein [Halanaerobacter jeridensis]|uniref:Dipeptidyl aminopeptidase/acylaminoacyl peptidase n=1 Tax=Halanaerobacter jeridensis TaxID=706427 RepID=A0A938XWL6_9FIRM|nr:prolyl oligopeptidase family serine peptidase [Halanaerobacter jeridensis]MBM7558154.1 dipeptidyl aminopeptidase/acylaminoacyl peptidase [Halanaerobacter jeridensis]
MKQDLDSLKNSNGKIISQKKLSMMPYAKSKSRFNEAQLKSLKENLFNKCKYYKIKYLSDKLKIEGFVIRPKENGKHPVIIFNRGGNREFGKVNKNKLIWLSSFASQGYVVIASQYRGVDGGQGKEELGGKDINDVLNLVPLAKSLKFVNKDKIGMLGFSRGGMMTYLAIKNNVDIEAAAVIGGVSNLIQNYKDRGMKMKKVYEELIGGSPSKYKQEYKDRSAYYWPGEIDVPVLIMHGEWDSKVDVKQAKNLSERLNNEDKDYKLMIFPNSYHGLRNKGEKRDRKIIEWFDNYLKD